MTGFPEKNNLSRIFWGLTLPYPDCGMNDDADGGTTPAAVV
jgi:hypothetical protein